jgi:hypothetical protein
MMIVFMIMIMIDWHFTTCESPKRRDICLYYVVSVTNCNLYFLHLEVHFDRLILLTYWTMWVVCSIVKEVTCTPEFVHRFTYLMCVIDFKLGHAVRVG